MNASNGDYEFKTNEHLHQWMFREKEIYTNSVIKPSY